MTPTTPSPISDQAAGEPVAYTLRHRMLLTKLQVGGCTCLTKTPEIQWHDEDCQYRLATEIDDMLANRSTAPTTGSAPAAYFDDRAVDEFARLMKQKMAASRAKGRGGWDDPDVCSVGSLSSMLLEHVAKGDPVDVANFCMMLRHYDAKIAARTPANAPVASDDEIFEIVANAIGNPLLAEDMKEGFAMHVEPEDWLKVFRIAASMGGDKS